VVLVEIDVAAVHGGRAADPSGPPQPPCVGPAVKGKATFSQAICQGLLQVELVPRNFPPSLPYFLRRAVPRRAARPTSSHLFAAPSYPSASLVLDLPSCMSLRHTFTDPNHPLAVTLPLRPQGAPNLVFDRYA